MKVAIKEISPSRRQMDIELPADQVQPVFDGIIKKYCKKAKLPGFRPGKVPANIVRKTFGEDIKQDVIQELFSTTYMDALKQEDVLPVFHPIVEKIDVEEGSGMTFSLLVDIRPEIKLKKYKGLKVSREVHTVTSDKVDESLQYVREQRAEYKPKEEGALMLDDDSCALDVTFEYDGNTIREDKEFRLLIQEDHFLKDIFPMLKSMSVGQTLTKPVTLTEGYPDAEYVGKTVQASITVKDGFAKELPVLDDEFAKDMGEFSTLNELKQRIEEDLKQSYDNKMRQDTEEAIVKELIANNPFDVPQTLVQEQERLLMKQMADRLVQQGIKEDDAMQHVQTMQDDFHKRAEEIIRMQFLLDEIGSKEKVEVSPEEIEERLEDIAKQMKQNKEQLRASMTEDGRFEQLAQRLKDDKILEILVKAAKIKDVKPKS